MSKATITTRLSILSAALLMASAAHAEFSTDGYFRAGTGAGSKGQPNSCFKLGSNYANQVNDGLNYRLGNECDTDVEISLKNTVKVGDVQFTGNIMPTYYAQSLDSSTSDAFKLGQAYIEGKGFDIAPDVNFWAGKRYYGRSDVHIVDTKFTKLDGTGGGADNINLGFGKLAVAYFRQTWGPVSRLNAEVNSININTNGWLRVLTTLTSAETSDGTTATNGQGKAGKGLTLQHYQDNFLGLGGNTLYVQYADGTAGIDGNVGNYLANNGTSNTVNTRRIVDSLNWQKNAFSGQAMAMLQSVYDGVGTIRTKSVGGRVAYAFTKNFKLQGELGHSQRHNYWNPSAERLTKVTIAPTLTTGPGFWERPELRLYVSHARWNAAAAENSVNSELPKGKTQATRYGLQAEIWW